MTKAKNEDKELRARQLLQNVRSKIQLVTKELESTKKQRDNFKVRLDELERGKSIILNGKYYKLCTENILKF